jgi:hypothetical protein
MNFLLRCLAILAILGFCLPAQAQGGWDTVKKPELGLTYKMARDYEAIPVDPLEEWTVLIYLEELDKDPKKRKKVQPRLSFTIIDHNFGLTTPTTGGDVEEAAKNGDSAPPINNFERYFEQRWRKWGLGLNEEGKSSGDYELMEWELELKKGKGIGTAYVYSNSARSVVMIGSCAPDDHKDQKKIWDAIVYKMKVTQPDSGKLDKEAQKMLDTYRKKGYLDPEFRVQARLDLPKGWKADDTENYILVYSTKDEPLIRLIKRELEAIREEYEKLFPPLAPVTAVSRVRICKDGAEYSAYGGPPGSGGYWNWKAQELVFFDYDDVDGEAGTGKANSRIVLYHEAFHQYIYYSSGSFSPHSWFNEGTGDFFSGAKISGGKVKLIGVNTWRIRTIQDMLNRDFFAPWKEIISWSQGQYYGNNDKEMRGGHSYAQGWSMIYFLRESKVAKKHEVWSTILDTYFETLRKHYNDGLAMLEESGMDRGPGAVGKLSTESKKLAIDTAFADVDFDEIEEAWKKFTLGLKVPK